MAMEYKNVRTTDIPKREGLLSALDDLSPLPAPYDKNGLEPAFKAVSYTHLDVYKRQGRWSRRADPPRSRL